MIRQFFEDKNNKKDFKLSYEKRANEAKKKNGKKSIKKTDSSESEENV